MPSGIANKLDELLKDGTSFDTRAGLRFLLELVKDAFEYIEVQRNAERDKTQTLVSFDFRIKNMEQGLHEWMETRRNDQKKAEEERVWWRRLILGSVLTLLITDLFKLFFGG